MQEQHISIDVADATQVYQQHAPAIFAYLRMRTSTWEDAEDLLTEIFLASLELETFWQMNEAAQHAWLWRVAHNKIVDHYRRAKRRPVLPLEQMTNNIYQDEEQEPERATLRQEEYAQLNKSMSQLPALQQQILRLRFVNGLRSPEIARIVGKREGAVRTMLARTLNLLHSIYEQH